MVSAARNISQTGLIGHWIAGDSVTDGAGRRGPVFDPATGETKSEVLLGGSSEVDSAVKAAKNALSEWSATTPANRARVMYRFRELLESHADELAGMVSSEHGKTFSDALAELRRGIEVVEFV